MQNAAADLADLALDALAGGRLRLALQPVRPATRPDRVAFHEGLARLDGLPGPALFVPALEARGAVAALDRAALGLALARLRAERFLRLSVNVSAASVGDPAWMAMLAAGAVADADSARRLIVELTETARPDPDRARHFRDFVAEAGAAFALDDFGAGHAEAGLAEWLRPDILKLDAGLARALGFGGAAAARAEARLGEALGLAARLEAMTVAEGVRDAAQAARLAARGVDAVQGFAFGVPELAAA